MSSEAEGHSPTRTSENAPATAPKAARAQGPDLWDQRIAATLNFLRRRVTGNYHIDDFGYDQDFTEKLLAPPLRELYQKWFRVRVSGLEHVPDSGAALVVSNHAGVVPLDGAMLAIALLDHHPAHRHLRMLAADLVFRMPFVGSVARKAGATLACPDDVRRLLAAGELTGVFPEGFKGSGKLYRDRYKLQRFGRGGFVSAALHAGAPIIPCAIVGAEETYPMIANAKTLARLLKLPYFPITPTFPWLGPLGAVPMPSTWHIEFCPPVDTAGQAAHADDPLVVFNLADQVRETIQQKLNQLRDN